MHRIFLTCLAVVTGLLTGMTELQAQGLIWHVPEPGSWVRYTGDYRQVTVRQQSAEGDFSLQWQRVLEFRCLSREQATWKGEEVSCVWLELEATTGQQVDGQLESGPGGTRIYKILVPEQEVVGLKFLELEIPRAYLPIVKGYRKIGNGAVEELTGPVFQFFPLLTQAMINEHTTRAGDEAVTVIAGSFEAVKLTNSSSIEDSTSRTSNVTNVWVSDAIPFGTVKWDVRINRETKTLVDTRDQFTRHSEITVQMQASQTGTDAVSKISTP